MKSETYNGYKYVKTDSKALTVGDMIKIIGEYCTHFDDEQFIPEDEIYKELMKCRIEINIRTDDSCTFEASAINFVGGIGEPRFEIVVADKENIDGFCDWDSDAVSEFIEDEYEIVKKENTL